ncbi:MAG: hypothetical protein ACRDQA_20105 [Nocardioidaceae bacterium]
MSSVWDDPELRLGGDFIKFDNVGDTVAGTISAVRVHRFEGGQVAPQILLTTDDGEEKTLTAGQVRLKTALAEQRPEAGDHITVTLTDVEPRAGGKSLKHFDVTVNRGGQPNPPPAATPAPAAATPPPAPPAAPAAVPEAVSPETLAALAKLTPEQKAAIGLG